MNFLDVFQRWISPNRCTGCYCVVSNEKSFCDDCYKEFKSIEIKRPRAFKYRGRSYLVTGLYKYWSLAGRIVCKYKFNHQINRARGIGFLMAERIKKKKLKNVDYITFVPMQIYKEIHRDLGHTEEIARFISMFTGIPYKRLLTKPYYTGEQHKLTPAQRKTALYDAFKAKKEAKDKTIILIDDVCTSGASICEAAKTLYDKGAKKVILMTFVMTRR